jgi:D-alanyl-D-alanine carboxypeptidase
MKYKLACTVILLLLFTSHTVYATSIPVEQLINHQHPLRPVDYIPSNLKLPNVLLVSLPHTELELAAPAADALTAMLTAAAQQDIELVITSGYRPYAAQVKLYAEQQQNPNEAKDFVAPPGYSEHQSGLAADLVSFPYFCAAQSCFMMTPAADWLAHNASTYGFIQRYPLGKELLTGYTYEPWHYRYVGKALAAYLYAKHLTLEEYYTSHA